MSSESSKVEETPENKPKKKVKPKPPPREIALHKWWILLDAYREWPGSIGRAAKKAGVSWPTAQKAWLVGLNYLPREWMRLPIKEILAIEQNTVRGKLLDERESAVAKMVVEEADEIFGTDNKARTDAILARQLEANIVRQERDNIDNLIKVTGEAIKGALKRAKYIRLRLESGKDEDGNEIPVKDYIEILWKLGRLVHQASQSGLEVFKMERLLLGDPNELTDPNDKKPVTTEEALKEIDDAKAAAERFRERRNQMRLIVNNDAPKDDDDESEDESSQ